MITPDLAETVRRLKHLADKASKVARTFHQSQTETIACPMCGGDGEVDAVTAEPYEPYPLGVQYFGVGDDHVTLQEFSDAANPAAISSILDALEGLERDLADAHARERALIGERDAAHRGRMEWFERATKAGSSLAEARKGARTKGTVEVCELCKNTLPVKTGDGRDCWAASSDCPVRAQHPTAPQETAEKEGV